MADAAAKVKFEVEAEEVTEKYMALRMDLASGTFGDEEFRVTLNVSGGAVYLERDDKPTQMLRLTDIVKPWLEALDA